MVKNHVFRIILVLLISCAFQSIDMRAEQALATTPYATATEQVSKKATVAKKKEKRKKSFQFFKKLKQKLKKKFAKRNSEGWEANRALIFGASALGLLLIGFLLAEVAAAVGAVLFFAAIAAGILAIVFGARARKQGMKSGKNTTGLILGIVTLGIVAILLTYALIVLLLIFAIFGA